jgi:sialate O-acetylesterase
MRKFGCLILLISLNQAVSANIRLPRIFGDNMVLQRNEPILIWGWKDKGEKITVQFNRQVISLAPTSEQKWMVRLHPEKEGGPFTLTVTGNNSIRVSNILVGEVWLCSGQSNMEMPIAGWGQVNNYQQEIDEANYPEIRHFNVPKATSTSPVADLDGGEWKICSPQTAGDFTAAGYFFARELVKRLKVPVGLVNCTWGGTMVETWISREGLEGSQDFGSMVDSLIDFNLEKIAQEKARHLIHQVELLQGSYTPDAVTDNWKDASLDDTRWPRMKLPGLWESQGIGLEDLDGNVWFRKVVEIPAEDAGKEAVIYLGKIDDSDDSYVNGIKVGSLKAQYNEIRHYRIPAGVLKAGKNLIAVRVNDTGGEGGIYGDESLLHLDIDGRSISLAGTWAFRVETAVCSGVGPNSAPMLLFNGMVHPLIPFAIRGVLWYQGEANTERAYQYRESFPLLIKDWRNHWKQGDFPFYFVQLASFDASNGDSRHGSSWAELREAQSLTLKLPNTGMAVATDIGDPHDIHPKNKQEVGRRLAAIALANCYGQANEYSGPVFQRMEIRNGKAMLSFSHIGSGLKAKDSAGILQGFEVAGSDHVFHAARANIEGETVIVYDPGVHEPVAVRYGWSDDAGSANLFNKEGFPASSFRTDHWEGITVHARYALGK